MTSSQINSAYQLARSTHARHQVARAATQYLEDSLSGALVTAIAALGQQRVNAALPVNLTVPVVFPDGTTYNFTFKGLEAIGADLSALFEPKVDPGKDGTLHIPAGLDYAWFEGVGSTESMERTIEWMRLQGVEVTSVSGGTITSCSFSDTTLLCRVRK